MTRNIKSRNKSITVTWIFSYVLIAVISLIFFFASYITSGKIISEQTQQFNEQVFDTTAKNTVDILNSMRKISYEISTDSTINIILAENDYNTFYSDKNGCCGVQNRVSHTTCGCRFDGTSYSPWRTNGDNPSLQAIQHLR